MKFDYVPRPKEMFVALGLPYEKIRFIQAVVEKEDPTVLYGAYLDDMIPGKERGFVKRKIHELPGPFFPVFSVFREPRKDLQAYLKLYRGATKIIENFLFEKEGYVSKIEEIESHIVRHQYTLDEARAVLKACLANSISYKYSKTARHEYFGFARRLKAFDDWFSGNMNTESLIHDITGEKKPVTGNSS